MKHGNLECDDNRKCSSHRKTMQKVERHIIGAEIFVVVLKLL